MEVVNECFIMNKLVDPSSLFRKFVSSKMVLTFALRFKSKIKLMFHVEYILLPLNLCSILGTVLLVL